MLLKVCGIICGMRKWENIVFEDYLKSIKKLSKKNNLPTDRPYLNVITRLDGKQTIF